MRFFKTKSGLELPFADIKGKDYILVPHRVQWFREEHPDWSIETSRVEATDKYVICRAEIRNNEGRLIATAHKREDYAHFTDALEKAETSAIGRALALCGYGTQFAHDLEEGHRIVDSPVERHANRRTYEEQPRQPSPQAQVSQGGEVVREVWTREQKKEYCQAKWGISDGAQLTPALKADLLSVCTKISFEEAMAEL